MLGDVDAVDLDHLDVETERSLAIRSFRRSADSACQGAADFDA
jgi:hypothetical protein